MLRVWQIRPFENPYLAVDPRRLDEIPQQIVDLMGYKIQMPFTGYGESAFTVLFDVAERGTVDGLSPRAGARRMVKWLQGPLDHSPPGFAKL